MTARQLIKPSPVAVRSIISVSVGNPTEASQCFVFDDLWPPFFTFFFLLTRSHLTLGCSFQTRKIKANNRMVAIISRPFLQSPLWYKIGCQGTLLWPSWVTISRWWTGRSAPGESLASAHRHTRTRSLGFTNGFSLLYSFFFSSSPLCFPRKTGARDKFPVYRCC